MKKLITHILLILALASGVSVYNTGCQSTNPTVNLVTNLAIRAGIAAAVTSNPGLSPILNTLADVFMNPEEALSPQSVRALALEEINEANWPQNYKLLAKGSIDDVILVYQDFYDRHKDNLTEGELATVLNRIGTSIKLGASLGSTGGAVPDLNADSGLTVTFN